MGPYARLEWDRGGPERLRQRLLRADTMHLLVEPSVLRVAATIFNESVEEVLSNGEKPSPITYDMRLPAPAVMLELPDAAYMLEEADTDGVNLWLVNAKSSRLFAMIERRSSAHYFATDVPDTPEMDAVVARCASIADIIISLLAEPRLARLAAPNRGERRRAKKTLGQEPSGSWHEIRWVLGSESVSKGDQSDEDHGRALHFVRAHWLRFDHPTPNSETRPGLSGHWVWRRHHWRGDPRFGIRSSRYRPEYDGEKGSARVAMNLVAERDARGRQSRSPD